jgi:hypothetical protein
VLQQGGATAVGVHPAGGDKVTVTANGDTGLGFQPEFFIETGHRWTSAGKLWECTGQLSPA